eukprot:6871566-Alexandrium_andersonii.AAC.1
MEAAEEQRRRRVADVSGSPDAGRGWRVKLGVAQGGRLAACEVPYRPGAAVDGPRGPKDGGLTSETLPQAGCDAPQG